MVDGKSGIMAAAYTRALFLNTFASDKVQLGSSSYVRCWCVLLLDGSSGGVCCQSGFRARNFRRLVDGPRYQSLRRLRASTHVKAKQDGLADIAWRECVLF